MFLYRDFLMVQWLRLRIPNARHPGLIKWRSLLHLHVHCAILNIPGLVLRANTNYKISRTSQDIQTSCSVCVSLSE